MEATGLKLLIASLVLTILGQIPFVSDCRQRAALVLLPLRYGTHRLGTSLRREISFWLSLRGVLRENQRLRERASELESCLVAAGGLRQDNERLREQLGLEIKGKGELLAANVIGWEDSSRQ